MKIQTQKKSKQLLQAAILLLAASLLLIGCPQKAKEPTASYKISFSVESGEGTITATVDKKPIQSGDKVEKGKP